MDRQATLHQIEQDLATIRCWRLAGFDFNPQDDEQRTVMLRFIRLSQAAQAAGWLSRWSQIEQAKMDAVRERLLRVGAEAIEKTEQADRL